MGLLNYLVVILVITCAPLVAFSKNAVQSILGLVVVVIAMCLLFFKANISYLTLVVLFTYLNAIIILILFVVLMLKLNTNITIPTFKTKNTWGKLATSVSFIFLVKFAVYARHFCVLFLVGLIHQSKEYNHSVEIEPGILVDYDYFIFRYIFQDAPFEFITLGFVLLFVMVGAVTLCIDGK